MTRSPSWTTKMKPTTDMFFQKERFKGTRSSLASSMRLYIAVLKIIQHMRRNPAARVSTKLCAKLSCIFISVNEQMIKAIPGAIVIIIAATVPNLHLLRFVNSIPSTFLTSYSAERCSTVKMRRLNHLNMYCKTKRTLMAISSHSLSTSSPSKTA